MINEKDLNYGDKILKERSHNWKTHINYDKSNDTITYGEKSISIQYKYNQCQSPKGRNSERQNPTY